MSEENNSQNDDEVILVEVEEGYWQEKGEISEERQRKISEKADKTVKKIEEKSNIENRPVNCNRPSSGSLGEKIINYIKKLTTYNNGDHDE